MLYWSVVFFILAVVAGVLGFGFLSSSMALAAKVLFVLFLGVFVLSLFRRGAEKVA